MKANVYNSPNLKKKRYELSFGSKIKVTRKKVFLKFDRGWIKNSDTKHASFKEKNLFKKITIFRNVKYKSGGKSYKGIDCSG